MKIKGKIKAVQIGTVDKIAIKKHFDETGEIIK